MLPFTPILFIILTVITMDGIHAAPLAASEVLTALRDDIPRIVGAARADLHQPNVLLKDAVRDYMQIPDGTPTEVDGHTLISGCRPHSCDEKSAALIDHASHHVQAIGIRHFHCSQGPAGPVACDRDATLLMVLVQRAGQGTASEPVLRQQLERWAARFGTGHEEIRRLPAPPLP